MLRSLCRLTPLWTHVRGPSHSHKSTPRTYDNDGRTSCHLRRCARCSTLRPMRVIRRAAPGVMPARSSATSWMKGMTPHSSLRLARTSPLQQCFCMAFPSPSTPRSGWSTKTSGHWWKPPPFNRRKAPHCDSDTRPLSPPQEWGHARLIAPSAHRYSHQVWLGRQWPHHGLTWRLLYTDRRYGNGPVHTKMLAASSATNIRPSMMMTSTGR